MSDNPQEQLRRGVTNVHVESGNVYLNYDQPARLEPLTAEDWDAGRKALGAGSKSLLFGTSTKVLDRIAEHFKRQAPTVDDFLQPAEGRTSDLLASNEPWRPDPLAERLTELDETTREALLQHWEFYSDAGEEIIVLGPHRIEDMTVEAIEDLKRSLFDTAERVEKATKERGEQDEPPSS